MDGTQFPPPMKRNRLGSALAALCGVLFSGLITSAWGRAGLPPPPAAENSAEPQRQIDRAPEAPRSLRGAPPRDVPRGNWRNLSPEQRDAIRRLSQEEREALANHPPGRPGAGPPPGARLSPQERRQLREQIREEHERRGGFFGRGKRP